MSLLNSLIPFAYAAFDSAVFGKAVKPIIDQIIYPIIYVVFALAVFIFVFGVIEMIVKGGDAEARSTGRKHMLYGAIGIFIMISAWGIIFFVSDSLKEIKNAASGTGQTIKAP